MSAEHGYYVGNDQSTARTVGRRRKADPLDHTYYIQGDGDTRRQVDPRVPPPTNTPRWRATCEVCPWLGAWHDGHPDGPAAANADGIEHRTTSLGKPGWDRCDVCGRRVLDTALCDQHAQAYEDSLANDKDPWQ